MVPLRYILRSLGRRKLRATMTILGVALAVAIYAVMNSVADTMVSSFRSTGLAEEVVITQAGTINVEFSNIDRTTLTYVQTLMGVAYDNGRPLVSPELYLGSIVRLGTAEHDVTVRGISNSARTVYRQARLTDGNWPAPGYEAVLGHIAAAKFGAKIGDILEFEGEEWTVVGLLDGRGTVYDQEIWVDLDDLSASANRTTYSSYLVRCHDEDAARIFVETISEGRRFPLSAQPASDFFASTGGMSTFMAFLGKFISIIIAIGAAFGGMNTMYSAIAGRRREIGILRALGYSRRAVFVAFLLESMLICLMGGFAGILLGLGLSEITIDLPLLSAGEIGLGLSQVTASLVLALLVGLFGGGLPALQAARFSVIDTIR